jgi:Zn-dependent protease with chaperone function
VAGKNLQYRVIALFALSSTYAIIFLSLNIKNRNSCFPMKIFKLTLLSILTALIALPLAASEVVQNSPFIEQIEVELTKQLLTDYINFKETAAKKQPESETAHPLLVDELFPTLFNMVKNLAEQMKIPMPQIFLESSAEQNASASKKNIDDPGIITISEGLLVHSLYSLSHSELHAVIAHELAHLKHAHSPKTKKLVTKLAIADITSSLAVLIALTYFSDKYHINRHTTVDLGKGILGLVTLLWALPFLKFSRSCEKEADITAAGFAHYRNLIAALRKLQKMNHQETDFSSIFNTHPSIKDREQYLHDFVTNQVNLNQVPEKAVTA